MVAWINQKQDQDGGGGLASSGKECWGASTKVN
jgi:hypothetical protein